MRVALTSVLLAAALACPAFGAGTKVLRPHDRGVAAGPPVSDGSRYLAWQVSTTQAVLLDGKTGEWRLLPAPTCEGGPDGHGVIAAIGAHKMLWACWQGTAAAYPLVETIGTTGATPVAGAHPIFASDGPLGVTFDGIGAAWISGRETTDHDDTALVYINNAGHIRRGSGETTATAIDLDRPSLTTPLCHGMSRPATSSDTTSPGTLPPFLYARPFGISLDSPAETTGALRLETCGHTTRRLSWCAESCTSVSLSPLVVSWISGGHAHVRRPTTGPAWSTRTALAPGAVIAATSKTAIIGQRSSADRSWRIWVAHWGR